MSGFSVNGLPGGAVNQSAVRMTHDSPEIFHELALNQPVRAIVLAVYYPDEETRFGSKTWAACCDVRTLGSRACYFNRVPIYQHVEGLWDEDVRIPRPVSIDVDAGRVLMEGGGERPSDPVSTDGDVVLLGFEEGNPRKPFVYPFGPPHPKRRSLVSSADGRVRRIRHNGTLIEIDKAGNVTIDASGASSDVLAKDGAQVATPAPTITIKTPAAGKIVLDGDSTQISSGATESVVQGTAFRASFSGIPAAVAAVGEGQIATVVNQILDALKAMPLSAKAKVG